MEQLGFSVPELARNVALQVSLKFLYSTKIVLKSLSYVSSNQADFVVLWEFLSNNSGQHKHCTLFGGYYTGSATYMVIT